MGRWKRKELEEAFENYQAAALKGAELNHAKKVLATEATALVHGREAADEAASGQAVVGVGHLSLDQPG